MGQVARQEYSFEEYVDLEEMSTVKHEYLEGQVWAMAGGTPEHAALAANVGALLSEQLPGKPSRVFSSHLRVRVKATGLGTYPDVSVVCERLEKDPEDHKGTTVVNPQVVVEVLSPSTEKYDRGEKLEHYKQVASLREIVLVEQGERCIEVWSRGADGWGHVVVRQGEARLSSLDVTLPIEEVYLDPLAASG